MAEPKSRSIKEGPAWQRGSGATEQPTRRRGSMASRHRNSVRILSSRERGAQSGGAQRLLQLLVEEKVRWMKSLMASTHVNHNIYITEVKTGKCLHSLVGHRRTPWCVTFHPTIPGLVASGCLDGEVRIWDLHGGSESWFTDSNVAIASLAFHPTAQLLLIATNNELHFWDWSRPEPFAVVKTGSETERVRLVRFDPLGHNLLTAIVNPSNQQSEEDSEVPMDSVELPPFRQRSFLPSQPVRRTPILHNFLHILSARPGAPAPGEQSRAQNPAQNQNPAQSPAQNPEPGGPFPGCTQHLGVACLCSRCSAAPPMAPSAPPMAPAVHPLGPAAPPLAPPLADTPPLSSTYSSARTEPRPPSDRPSAFTSVYYGAGGVGVGNGVEPHGAPRTGPDWTRNLLSMREGLLPPRTSSSSSVSLLSVLRQQDGSAHSPLYTSASEGRGFPPGDAARDAAGTSSGHHPFWDGSRGGGGGSGGGFRNALQCNLSRYFLEIDRIDMDPALGGAVATDGAGAGGAQEPSQELLNNNLEPARPGPSSPNIVHYQPPLPPPPLDGGGAPPHAARGHLNRCRACHNLLTFNHDSQRWERTSQTSSTSASGLEPAPSGLGPAPSGPGPAPSPSAAPWQPEEGRRGLEAPPPGRTGPPEPSQQPPHPAGAAPVAFPLAPPSFPLAPPPFPLAPPPSQAAEQTVGLMYNQDTAQWERVLSPAAYYAQRMIQYLSRRDSIRQRSLRYQQNRLRAMSSSMSGSMSGTMSGSMSGSSDPPGNPPGAMDGGEVDFEDLDDNGDRARHRTPRNARMSAPSLGRFVPRRFLLPEYLPYAGIFHERGQPGLATHSSVNRVLAGASIGDGQSAVASNIANTTYRLQWWDFTQFDLPEISNASVNVLVPNCKIYNDASCDISADGQLLAVFIPSSQRGFPDEGILAVYSLAAHNLGEMLYTKRFGPNAISVSLSPMGCYVMVGLASRRILLHPTTDHMVAQVFRLQQPHGGETSMRMVFNVVYPMAPDQRRHVSINSARWLPDPGMGLAYGTNKGDLVLCRPVFYRSDGDGPAEPSSEPLFSVNNSGTSRTRGSERPGNPAPSVTSQGTQTPVIQLQNAQTQTDLAEPAGSRPPPGFEAPSTSRAAALEGGVEDGAMLDPPAEPTTSAAGSGPAEPAEPGPGEDALARIRRLIAEGGMTAVVQREQSTTMASMGGFGNNIIGRPQAQGGPPEGRPQALGGPPDEGPLDRPDHRSRG
ncbi:unnamed protein product, partial [Menidia menidia]